jgi:2-polyprenyl-6-methoxyphenol hydroxylase-like FAD-dependent oxidoreductase
MEAEVTDLVFDGARVAGVTAKTPDGALTVKADLVVGCDGRHSRVRDAAQLPREEFGVPIDVMWLKLSRKASDSSAVLGRIAAGAIFVTLDRGDYWQCALVIPKGGADALRARGLEEFRALIARIAPLLADRTGELTSWDQIKLLTVTVDRLRRWHRDGLLCIGDAAHAMSPIGGVGINLAIQDAVAAANILAGALHKGMVPTEMLAKVQARRTLPTKLTQAVQRFIQDRIMTRVLNLKRDPKPPFLVKLLDRCAILRRIPARLVGLGVRPEHVRDYRP